MDQASLSIRRLGPVDTDQIVDCFRRVYGDSYANDQFYDAQRLVALMQSGTLNCVGAVDGAIDGEVRLLGHMAMSRHAGARSVELGNTVVDPEARGAGVAWKIGAELSAWSVELGYRGYLHYPTTDHHIMQRHSVERGFETGLMLGYVPAETDGKVGSENRDLNLRQACTIVYQPLQKPPADAEAVYLPSYCDELIQQFAATTGLPRRWLQPDESTEPKTVAGAVQYEKRGLRRLDVSQVGRDIGVRIADFESAPVACMQIDFSMADAGIDTGIAAARDAGYWFCGWLPGFTQTDVIRLQKVDRTSTNLRPNVVNPVAQSLVGLRD